MNVTRLSKFNLAIFDSVTRSEDGALLHVCLKRSTDNENVSAMLPESLHKFSLNVPKNL